MSAHSKKSDSTGTVLWWVGWIVLTILAFFAAAAFWTPLIARKFGTVRDGSAAVWWVAAVFGSWMTLLVPLIVVMYSKVDKAYEDARIRREAACAASGPKPRFRSIWIEPGERNLPRAVRQSLNRVPKAVGSGRLVTAFLRDGRKVPYVFIVGGGEVLGVYGKTALDFSIADIVGLEGADLDRLPVFREEEWLRLDGAGIKEA